MINARIFGGGAVWSVLLGFCLPASALAADPPLSRSPAVVDVALRDGGMLYGQVVDPQGNAVSDTPVALSYDNREIGRSRSDTHGTFAFQDLRGGVHRVAAADGLQTYRLWAPGTAPPTAQPTVQFVAHRTTAPGPMPQIVVPFFKRPWVVGGIAGGLVATAISVPVALLNTDESTPASP